MQSVSPLTSGSTEFRAVLFDLDGTLIDSKPLIKAAFVHALKQASSYDFPVEGVPPLIGLPLRAMFERVYGTERQARAPEGGVDSVLAIYREYLRIYEKKLLKVFPGVIETLEALRGAGVRLAVVTSKMDSVALRHMKLFSMDSFFDTMVFEQDTARHKPEPDPFLLASSRLEVPAGQCLAVGDAIADLQSARAAGMRFGAAAWGAEPLEPLLEEEPDYVFNRPGDILEVPSLVRSRAAFHAGKHIP
jgi:pyrophosphatase PpaX